MDRLSMAARTEAVEKSGAKRMSQMMRRKRRVT